MSDTKHESTNAEKVQRNEDPLSGEAGAHPVGTGVGAALGGAATGAAVGTVAGPIGTLIGTAFGAVAGGLVGKAVAEEYDPTVEIEYWRGEYTHRPYYDDKRKFIDYEPAYQAGIEAYDAEDPVDFSERERVAQEQWEARSDSTLGWDEARHAAEDAYKRVLKRSAK
jgi:phage tail tape-measure protein